MSRSLIFSFLVSAFLMGGCGPTVTFDQPQPSGVRPLESFPDRAQGSYLADDSSSTLIITKNLITINYHYIETNHKDSLGSDFKVLGDPLINYKNHSKEKIELSGDSVIQLFKGTDTLFFISKDNVLNKYKGYYFLNYRLQPNMWKVKNLSLKKGRLTIGSISEKDEIQKLKTITETNLDTLAVPLSPTKHQFKKFVKQGGFSDQAVFFRLNG